jgi:hypothetical protein
LERFGSEPVHEAQAIVEALREILASTPHEHHGAA